MPDITLNLSYKGQSARHVPEYAEVEARLRNGPTAQAGLSLWLGDILLRDNIILRPQGEFVTTFNVSDWIGQIRLYVKHDGQPLAEAALEVLPTKLSQADVEWIRIERLPTLLARLDAPNSLRLSYAPPEDERPPFDFISLDFTALKLRHYSRLFLEDGLAERLLRRLAFQVEERTRREEGFIRGQVRWQPTIESWANRPAETGLVHQWVETPRNWNNLLNQLFVHFLQFLGGQNRELLRLVRAGAPASPRLKAGLSEFDEYAARLESLIAKPVLRPLVSVLRLASLEPPALSDLKKAAESASNPAYSDLVTAWAEFSGRYVALDTAHLVGLQPMSKLYELWAACEVAGALGLGWQDGPGLESAVFSRAERVLYYNQGMPGGWYSAQARRRPPRPDLRLTENGTTILLLDVKYRQAGRQAQPDDMYRMLAYMNDFDVLRGGIIFPGSTELSNLTAIEQTSQTRQTLAQLALRPPASVGLSDWEEVLKKQLDLFTRKSP